MNKLPTILLTLLSSLCHANQLTIKTDHPYGDKIFTFAVKNKTLTIEAIDQMLPNSYMQISEIPLNEFDIEKAILKNKVVFGTIGTTLVMHRVNESSHIRAGLSQKDYQNLLTFIGKEKNDF